MKLLEKIIQRRNPDFRFHESADTRMTLIFVWSTGVSLLRGLKLFLSGKNPKGAMLAAGTKFKYIHKISFGKWLKLGERVTLSGLSKNGIRLGNRVSIGSYSQVIVSTTLNAPGEHIKLGNNVGIGEFAYLGGAGGLTIGDDCIVGQYFSCHAENHNYGNPDELIRHQGIDRKGIVIGSNCWVGSKVTILDGVTIGEGCVIAAGSVVTKSMPPHSVIGGVPAKVLKATTHSTLSKVS